LLLFATSQPPYLKQNCFFSLCGDGGYRIPQDGSRRLLLFGFAMFFFVCFGVASGFFSTRFAWLHVEAAFLWMWKHAPFVFFSTRTKA
jgi:hypothetical protein